MKINYLVLGLLLGTIDIEAHKIVQRSKDSDEDKALSAINAAIDQELGDDTPIKEDKALAAVENADAAGTLPDASNMEGGVADDAEKKKIVVDGPPPAVSEMDANGNKKTEVELLMERADHDEANEKWLHSPAYKKQQKKAADEKLKK